ncbi:hypothetical protein O181_002120 [Austropuccinia psidii MF-1]|uniref:Uncharacterized protein n=1 Tax=Austropuccinia psidii MF-1 TaxID=1389203 RepID=A0A9Q3BCF2_9BASI|nr:hypothetical protein [Austropuccinia psidii MF-1]
MPVQHSPPERKTRSQARTQAPLTPKPRAPLDGTPGVPQLGAHLGKAPSKKEGRGRRRSRSFPGAEEEDTSVEEEEQEDTEAVPSPVGDSKSTEGPTLSQSNQLASNKSDSSLLGIMKQMTKIMEKLQEA